MSWDGTERRRSVARSEFCEQHLPLSNNLATLVETTKNIETKMVENATFRNGVIVAFITVIFLLVVQIAGFAFFYGQLARQVQNDADKICKLEALHYTNN